MSCATQIIFGTSSFFNRSMCVSLHVFVVPGLLSNFCGFTSIICSLCQAREIFQKICPNEEFLPSIPNPEDIIYDEPSSPEEEDKDVPSGERGSQQGWEGEDFQPENESEHGKENSSQDTGSNSARSSE